MFYLTMDQVEEIIAEHEAREPAQSGNHAGGMPHTPWRDVRTMGEETKRAVQETLDELALREGLGELTLGRDNRRYVAMHAGTPHPLVDIVQRSHTGTVVLWRGERVQ